MTHALSLVRACRPRQWSKNVLVFAAPAAGGVLGEGPILWRSLVAFAVFCLVSSATHRTMVNRTVLECLDHGEVGVLELDVLTDDRNPNLARQGIDSVG